MTGGWPTAGPEAGGGVGLGLNGVGPSHPRLSVPRINTLAALVRAPIRFRMSRSSSSGSGHPDKRCVELPTKVEHVGRHRGASSSGRTFALYRYGTSQRSPLSV